MRQPAIFRLMMAFLVFVGVFSGCRAQDNRWRERSPQPGAEHYPTLHIWFRSGRLSDSRTTLDLANTLAEFRALAKVAGHPQILLTVPRREMQQAKPVMKLITETRVCVDSPCIVEHVD